MPEKTDFELRALFLLKLRLDLRTLLILHDRPGENITRDVLVSYASRLERSLPGFSEAVRLAAPSSSHKRDYLNDNDKEHSKKKNRHKNSDKLKELNRR